MTDGDKELREKILESLGQMEADILNIVGDEFAPKQEHGSPERKKLLGLLSQTYKVKAEALEALLSAVQAFCEQREDRVYRQGRIAAIEEYLDVCNDEEVEPSYLTLEEYQRGQLHAFKDIYDTQSRQPGGEADKHASE